MKEADALRPATEVQAGDIVSHEGEFAAVYARSTLYNKQISLRLVLLMGEHKGVQRVIVRNPDDLLAIYQGLCAWA